MCLEDYLDDLPQIQDPPPAACCCFGACSGNAGNATFTTAGLRGSVFQQPVLKEGYLEKRSSGLVKKWQSWYFELSGHYIKYYERKQTKSDGTLKGAVDLQEISEVAYWGAQIIIVMNDGKKLNLKSRSAQVAEVWVTEIQQVVAALSAAAQAKEAVKTLELHSEHPVAQQMVKNPVAAAQ
jgi:hypothetical protein